MRRISRKLREIVDEIRQTPQMSKLQGFVNEIKENIYRERNLFFCVKVRVYVKGWRGASARVVSPRPQALAVVGTAAHRTRKGA